IKATQVEALKEENWKNEHITSYIPHIENDSQGIKTRQGRIHIPFRSNTIQTLKDMLRACVIDFRGNWDDHLPLVEFSYNNSYYASIKMPPYEMNYGRKCQKPVCWEEVWSRELASTDVVLAITENIETIREKLKVAQDRWKSYADNRRRPIEFNVGDLIMIKVSPWKDDVKIDPEITTREEPAAILGRNSRQLHNKEISLVKVQWKHRKGISIRWEPEEKMKIRYPHLIKSRFRRQSPD
nr:reverse transcriptase [Tanacetum cinerariifolium]